MLASEWLEPGDNEKNIAWTRETYDALSSYMQEGSYVNYLGDDESADRVQGAYGDNYERLQKLKTQYDPDNVFHLNQNILPG